MSGGGGASKSQASNSSKSFVDPAQAPYLEALRSGAMNSFQGMQPGFMQEFGRAGAGADLLSGIRFSNPSAALAPATSGLQGFTGANPYASQLGEYAGRMAQGNSPGMEAVIGNLGEDINRQLSRMIGGPGGINTASELSGTFGGGRNQVSQGIAQEGALNTFGTQAGQLRLQDYQARQGQALQALQSAGGMFGTGEGQRLGALGALGGLESSGLGTELAQGLGLGTLQSGASALGMSPFTNQMSLWQQLAGVLGGPTVLQSGKGKSQSATMSGYGG